MVRGPVGTEGHLSLAHPGRCMPQNNQRQPAVPKDIEEIDPERDVRVRVLGTVIETRDDSIMLDDGSGTVEVFLDEEHLDSVSDGQRIRVLGRVLPAPDSFEIQGEIVQDMSDIDMDAYNTVKNISPHV